jgi:hypothetical protein
MNTITATIARLYSNTALLKDYQIADSLPHVTKEELLEGLKKCVDQKLLVREFKGNVFEYRITEEGKFFLDLLEIGKQSR